MDTEGRNVPMYFTYFRLSLPIPLPREHTQIEHHTAFATTMTNADLRKSNVIDLTQKTPAKKQHIDRKRLCQSDLMAFLNPKRVCESAEGITINLSVDAVDVDADAVDAITSSITRFVQKCRLSTIPIILPSFFRSLHERNP